MEQLPLVTVLVILSTVMPATVSHKLLHAGELINRENAKIRLETGIKVSVYPAKYLTSGDWVKMSWQYVSYPSVYDWIGVYSPPLNDIYLINPSVQAPIKVQFANVSENHMIKGRGKTYFKLLNMRHPVVMGFFRGGFDSPTLVAISSVIQFSNYNIPLQGHLALTQNPTEMILQWSTLERKMPVVYYGTESGSYSYVKSAVTTTYNSSDMCDSPATDWGWREPGLLHTVVMDSLQPGQKYYYIFGDYYGWSEEKTFKAAPPPYVEANTTVIAYGDMGCSEEDGSFFLVEDIQPDSFNTTRMIEEQIDDIDFVLHIGDISYARGFSSVWDIFFNQIEPIATRVPYMVCIGNHERNAPDTYPGLFNNTESGGECGVPHYHRFPMPRPAFDEPWFGFSHGKVHFVMMSTEHDFRKGTKQYRALKEYLRTVDREVTPWLVFAGHRPMYIASSDRNYPDGHQPVATELRTAIEPLLKKFAVDVALWAHHHSYQRTCPVFRQKCRSDGKAPVHVVIGMGGRELSTDLIPRYTPSWIEALDYYHYGFTKLSANSTTLTFEFIRHEDGKVHDSFILRKTGEGSGAYGQTPEQILSPFEL